MMYEMYNTETVNNCIDSMVREIEQQQERISELESLVRDMFSDDKCFRNRREWYRKRMKELGIEVSA